jgi:hypothetical protein
MSNIDELLVEILREAAEPGDLLAPSHLLSAVASQSHPIRALSDIDQANALFEALKEEFSFVWNARITGRPVGLEDRKRWTALVRWLICELSQWRDLDDPQRRKFMALFVVTGSCDWGNIFWSALPDGPGENSELGTALERAVSSCKVEFKSRGTAARPIWEQEAVDAFRQADERGNWVEIAEKWRPLESALLPNPLQEQMVRYLYRYAFDRLERALRNVSETPVTMRVAAALTTEQRLKLANSSHNPRIQFSCVHLTLHTHTRRAQLLPGEQLLLSDLLVKVANESPIWEAWMRIFNAYPARYPALQAPLGRALASAPLAAIKTYVDSINLSPTPAASDESRRRVAECLRNFKETATPDLRKFLWEHAHDRWQEWEFGRADQNTHLLAINWSQLDYAIVAYAVECMEKDACEKVRKTISEELNVIETTWHESLSSCITRWYRILSQFQPYARADFAIQSGGDWLAGTEAYAPSASLSDYVKMMFSA